MRDGRVVQVNVSEGGVPKRPVPSAMVTALGVEGDRQREVTVHGGPHRAVSLLGIEAIRRVAAEGHPIEPGSTGENLTTEGFDVSTLPLGTRLHVGEELVLEISATANPCRTIRRSFSDLRFGRLSRTAHATDSRMYARVVRVGRVEPGDEIRLEQPADDAAARYEIAARLDRAERASTIAVWRAAVAAGHDVAIVDDGELALAAAPTLPGPIFNQALGFAHLPNLVQRAVDHFLAHRATGWVWAESPPWDGVVADATAVYAAARPGEVTDGRGADGLVVRELRRDEVGTWSAVIVEAAELPQAAAVAWRALEPELALVAHHHRFVAELDGRPVAAASLHTHHGVGWMRSGSVLPHARGLGIQRALIGARAARAAALGCDLVGASAAASGVSATNLDRCGFTSAAVRQRYRVEPPAAPASSA